MNAMPSKPLASAWRARSAMSAADNRTCGRNRYHSTMHPPMRMFPCDCEPGALVYYFYYVRGLMDVGLNSEQLSLRDTVRDILRTECPPDAARQAMTDPERWRAAVEDGRRSRLDRTRRPRGRRLRTRRAGRGSRGMRRRPRADPAAEQRRSGRGRRCGARASTRCSTDIAGGVVATLAVHAKGSRLPGAPMTLRGRAPARAGGRGPQPVPRRAARHAGAIRSTGTVAAVARCGDGVTVIAGESTDPAQPVADVEIDAEPLATAPVDLESALTAPLVAAAADLVGVASAALHRSVEHAKTRRQFGTPIGAFQGIKHALADNYVGVERARSLTYAAAARLGDPGPSARGSLDRRGAGQGGGRRRGGQLRAHRGSGTRRARADLGARHPPLRPARLAGRRDAGRQPRALPRGRPPLRREARNDAQSVRGIRRAGWRTSCRTTTTRTIANTAGI